VLAEVVDGIVDEVRAVVRGAASNVARRRGEILKSWPSAPAVWKTSKS
jgi:hypothetical protein